MADWLPAGFEEREWEQRAARALIGVKAREERRRRRVRIGAGLGAAAVLLLALPFVPGPERPSTGQSVPPAAAPVTGPPLFSLSGEGARPTGAEEVGTRPSSAAAARPTGAEEMATRPPAAAAPSEILPRLEKAGDRIVVTWPGEPGAEYVVYKCASPSFESCARKAEVRGNRFLDGERDESPVVFYKVERKG